MLQGKGKLGVGKVQKMSRETGGKKTVRKRELGIQVGSGTTNVEPAGRKKLGKGEHGIQAGSGINKRGLQQATSREWHHRGQQPRQQRKQVLLGTTGGMTRGLTVMAITKILAAAGGTTGIGNSGAKDMI